MKNVILNSFQYLKKGEIPKQVRDDNVEYIKNKNGQSLIETLAALAVVMLTLLGLIVVTTLSIRNATFSRNQTLATKYAQQSIEDARRLRDTQAASVFFSDDFVTNVCGKADSPSPLFSRIRTCNLTINGSQKTMDVVVTVSWTDGLGNHQSKLETYLTNWK